MLKVAIILGIRPNIIKLGPLMRRIERDTEIEQVIINTGQHYDYNMSKIFFDTLKIPLPDYNLEVGSGTQAYQVGQSMIKIEEVLLKEKPNLTIVVGDGNPTLAGALASVKLHIPVLHIEAGLRSYDRNMPEEINRITVDRISDFLQTPLPHATKTLIKEGIPKEKIWETGDITADAVREHAKIADKESNILERLGLQKDSYILATVHRAENTDDPKRLKNIMGALDVLRAVIPLHPRTKKIMEDSNMGFKSLKIIEPINYLDSLKLLKYAKVLITDSGGMQKESFILKVPCITCRNSAEWVETLESGANILAGDNTKMIIDEANKRSSKEFKARLLTMGNPYGNNVSDKILDLIKKKYKDGKLVFK
ncbi:MAG TPA: UDP-N-acetylglucosamine 2-epimerase (non-hydrolyzing) [Candidatus Nanoarchaeia archaeon]|nr:UDP-N-acetylglucosamine 2-epimerase (non-hydrolyzing) [Candidatus Nanoarchaeia archaeon]